MENIFKKFAGKYPKAICTNYALKERFITIVNNFKGEVSYLQDHYEDGSVSESYEDYALRQEDGYYILMTDNSIKPIIL